MSDEVHREVSIPSFLEATVEHAEGKLVFLLGNDNEDSRPRRCKRSSSVEILTVDQEPGTTWKKSLKNRFGSQRRVIG